MPELPAGFSDKFTTEDDLVDDPKLLMTKEQVVEMLIKTQQATMAFVKTITEADLDKPAAEKFSKMFPTVGNIVRLPAMHVMMHLGQIQVARRKLGKPIIF